MSDHHTSWEVIKEHRLLVGEEIARMEGYVKGLEELLRVTAKLRKSEPRTPDRAGWNEWHQWRGQVSMHKEHRLIIGDMLSHARDTLAILKKLPTGREP